MTESPLITVPGVYPASQISLEDYHGREICPDHSVSSSGLRTIENESLFHYWYNSPLNPNRPEREDKPHFQIGKLLHELMEHGDKAWRGWHITPDGFSEHHVKKWEASIAELAAAVEAGKQVIRFADAQTVLKMIAALRNHPRAKLMFQSGEYEPTLAWKDEETGLWCRVRPDYLPKLRKWIPDLKSTVSAHPDDFGKSVVNFGYHMAAALYLDGIKALFGDEPEGFMLIAQEKTEPHVVELFQLDNEAIGWGRSLNRRSLRRLADALSTDKWPTYGAAVNLAMLPDWTRKQYDLRSRTGELDLPH